MTGPEAEQVAARMSLHLRRNEFAACHEILNSLREDRIRREFKEPDPDDPIPIVEVLEHEMRCVSMLEKRNYLYIEDLDDVDLVDLIDPRSDLFIPYFGKKGVQHIEEGCRRAEVIRERRRRDRKKRLEKLEKVGEPLLDTNTIL